MPAAKLLLVDDTPENIVALDALVRGEGREVHSATSADEALSLLVEHDFALAILDVQMPNMNGFQLAELMRSTSRTKNIPIIFVTAASRDQNYAFQGYEAGAVDFLYKPLDAHTVRSKVDVFVQLFLQRQELQAARADAERAVKAREDLMSMVTHELRTPIGTMLMQVELRQALLAEGKLDLREVVRLSDRDERQLRSMLRLIDDMLDFARLRTGRIEIARRRCDLARLVQRVVDALRPQGEVAGYTVELQSPPQLELECDEQRVEQVLVNLLTNAFRYGQRRPVQVTLACEEGCAKLSVADQGVGIAEADQSRVFEQFERTESARPVHGLGLGLFIARQIVEAHGGRISLRSSPGKGSEFSVWLPLTPPPVSG